jgi:hypothetical protein
MVITTWAAEHGDEVGLLLLNDWALGSLFGGRAGFEARLREQGFTNVRNLLTPTEFATMRSGKAPSTWSGPWLTQYPWEVHHD